MVEYRTNSQSLRNLKPLEDGPVGNLNAGYEMSLELEGGL
jgi:hypothetical protein